MIKGDYRWHHKLGHVNSIYFTEHKPYLIEVTWSSLCWHFDIWGYSKSTIFYSPHPPKKKETMERLGLYIFFTPDCLWKPWEKVRNHNFNQCLNWLLHIDTLLLTSYIGKEEKIQSWFFINRFKKCIFNLFCTGSTSNNSYLELLTSLLTVISLEPQ